MNKKSKKGINIPQNVNIYPFSDAIAIDLAMVHYYISL